MSMKPFPDQTFCPKCHRMYCEGFWGRGVCIVDMHSSSDPTSRGDNIAEYLRVWYEANRETWLDRHYVLGLNSVPDRNGVHADEFMLALLNEVGRIYRAMDMDERTQFQKTRAARRADLDELDQRRAADAAWKRYEESSRDNGCSESFRAGFVAGLKEASKP